MSNAIVGIDLAERKQMVVVTDHDSRVLARNDAEDALRLNGGRVGHFPRGFFPDGVRRAEVESLARFHEQADQPSPWVMTCYA